MRLALAFVAVVASALTLTGCTAPAPTYEQVRAETEEVLRQVADRIPDPKELEITEGIEPYSCSDALTLGDRSGSFYTGQWAVYVDDSFDVPSFISEFPEALGAGWRAMDLGVSSSTGQIYLVRESPHMSLGIRELTIDGRKAIDLLAISRCGTLSEDQRP
ncbi:hypothetical protein NS183_06585 [Microbacterium testaceum]|uniref:hypothetical protein n=1 Tax=Microbacterium testaceum TaxID=2033 RepID=UPI000734BACA|nr:hypothetical protein [Microbacterium testaceum]KTS90954.1 hypothetical protein NS183_06585 [Microbacterium testaceum]